MPYSRNCRSTIALVVAQIFKKEEGKLGNAMRVRTVSIDSAVVNYQ